MSTYTQASALAYALAKLYRGEDTLRVIGGSHAKAFPMDCLRFFYLVVQECDKTEDDPGIDAASPVPDPCHFRLIFIPCILFQSESLHVAKNGRCGGVSL